MENSFIKNPFKSSLKYSIPIFIFLAILVSLFPPFYWSSNRNVSELLPLKEYSFILGSNKKYFALKKYTFRKKYYNYDTKRLDSILSDAITHNIESNGTDTFTTEKFFAYKVAGIDDKEWNELMKDTPINKNSALYRLQKRLWRYKKQDIYERIKLAENYMHIKGKFTTSSKDWRVKKEREIDSIKEYDLHRITKPKYFLLSRDIILSELVVNYMLAIFLSIGLGFIIKKLRGTIK